MDGLGKKVPGSPNSAPTGDGFGQKTLIQQSRYLWFFSSYSAYKSSPEALAIAKKVLDYIAKRKGADGLIPYSLDSAPPDPRIHLYAQYFAIYGLAAYAIASKTSSPAESLAAQNLAMDVFKGVDKKFLYPKSGTTPIGYMDTGEFSEGQPVTDKNEGTNTPTMSFNAVMHGIEALAELHKANKDPGVGTRLKMLMDLVVDKMYVPTEFRIVQFYDPTSANNLALPNMNIIDYGHNIEMVFLMDFATTTLELQGKERDKYMKPMMDISKNMLKGKTSWDSTLKAVKDNNDPSKQSKKDWWTQFEAMAGSEWMYRATQDKDYRGLLDDMVNFVKIYFYADLGGGKGEFYPAIENKGGKWESTGTNQYIASNWKSNYHVGRTLLLLDQWLASAELPSVDFAAVVPTSCTFTMIDKASKPAEYATMLSYASNRRLTAIVPRAFLEPSTEIELATMIKCANKSNIKWTVRNGGHSYEGLSLITDGYVIDIRKLIGVEIDATKKTAVVGAGELFGNVYAQLAAKNLYIPAGTGPNVGVSGVTLGGGIGYATRKRGVTCNSVISARVVTAEGDVKILSDDKPDGSDLLEALRGGGPFYAIVTQWTFEVYPAPVKAFTYQLSWGNGQENNTNKLTQEIAVKVLKAFVAGTPWMADENYALIEFFHGFSKVDLVIHYYQEATTSPGFTEPNFVAKMKEASAPDGPAKIDEFNNWVDYIVKITDLEAAGLTKWTKANLTLEKLRERTMTKQDNYTASSLLFSSTMPVTEAHINALTMAAKQRNKFFYQFRAFGGKSSASSRKSSWPHTDSLMEVQIYAINDDPPAKPVSDGIIAGLMTLPSKGYYYNYYNSSITKFTDYFPDATISNKLIAVKTKYDPQNRILTGTAGAPVPALPKS